MKKTFCDSCKKEIKNGESILRVDINGAGFFYHFELCQACYDDFDKYIDRKFEEGK